MLPVASIAPSLLLVGTAPRAVRSVHYPHPCPHPADAPWARPYQPPPLVPPPLLVGTAPRAVRSMHYPHPRPADAPWARPYQPPPLAPSPLLVGTAPRAVRSVHYPHHRPRPADAPWARPYQQPPIVPPPLLVGTAPRAVRPPPCRFASSSRMRVRFFSNRFSLFPFMPKREAKTSWPCRPLRPRYGRNGKPINASGAASRFCFSSCPTMSTDFSTFHLTNQCRKSCRHGSASLRLDTGFAGSAISSTIGFVTMLKR